MSARNRVGMVPLCAAVIRDREGIVSDASEYRVGSHKSCTYSLRLVCGIVRGSYPFRDARARDRGDIVSVRDQGGIARGSHPSAEGGCASQALSH